MSQSKSELLVEDRYVQFDRIIGNSDQPSINLTVESKPSNLIDFVHILKLKVESSTVEDIEQFVERFADKFGTDAGMLLERLSDYIEGHDLDTERLFIGLQYGSILSGEKKLKNFQQLLLIIDHALRYSKTTITDLQMIFAGNIDLLEAQGVRDQVMPIISKLNSLKKISKQPFSIDDIERGVTGKAS